MACSRPLKCWVVGYNADGKKLLYWNSSRVGFQPPKDFIEELEIPCGQCVSCRLQYSRQWADRCMMELQSHDSSYFVTLTYNDSYINRDDSGIRRYYADENTGEAKVSLSLRKKDLQDFIKRLRKEFKNDHIRYYACGEYGDKTLRPHYHAVIFGLHLDDLKYYKSSGLKDVYYNSEKLSQCWSYRGKNGKKKPGIERGFVVVGKVTWETCAYTARYVLKKAKGKTAEAYQKFNMEQEFVLMSRKPAIGFEYMQDHCDDFIKYGSVYLSSSKGSVQAQAPRYFKQQLQKYLPKEYEVLRSRSMSAGIGSTANKLQLTDLDLEELREVEEAALVMRTKALRREL